MPGVGVLGITGSWYNGIIFVSKTKDSGSTPLLRRLWINRLLEYGDGVHTASTTDTSPSKTGSSTAMYARDPDKSFRRQKHVISVKRRTQEYAERKVRGCLPVSPVQEIARNETGNQRRKARRIIALVLVRRLHIPRSSEREKPMDVVQAAIRRAELLLPKLEALRAGGELHDALTYIAILNRYGDFLNNGHRVASKEELAKELCEACDGAEKFMIEKAKKEVVK